MFFNIPTVIFAEQNCIENHSDFFKKYSGKALIVTGNNSALKTGALDDITNALDKCGISHRVFSGVKENPTDDLAAEIAEYGIKEKVNFVIGLGGGSPIDAAKSASVLIANPQCDKTILVTKIEVPHVPVIAIPTTAGPAAEVTQYASIIISSNNEKRSVTHRIFPDAAFIDIKYLKYVPGYIFNNTITEILAHLIESKLNRRATHFTKMMCDYGLKLWSEAASEIKTDNIPQTYGETLSDDAYTLFSLASILGGMSIAHTGTAIPHAISNCLICDYGVPRGQSVGVFITAYIRNTHDDKMIYQILNLMGLSNLQELEEKISILIKKIEIKSEDRARYIQTMSSSKARNCPYTETPEVLADFFDNNMLLDII